ncbi:MAG: hypothetical protein OYL97_11315 [Candidatus Poribacteria bacterium]|nr:hypothetical protein [Candidatus Poribacteria bacterium]
MCTQRKPLFQPQHTNGPTHPELRISFTATADREAPIPAGLHVTFEDYPETPPTGDFNLTIIFSEPATGSTYQAGLGYDPDASPETSLGTPGYSEAMVTTEAGSSQISFAGTSVCYWQVALEVGRCENHRLKSG